MKTRGTLGRDFLVRAVESTQRRKPISATDFDRVLTWARRTKAVAIGNYINGGYFCPITGGLGAYRNEQLRDEWHDWAMKFDDVVDELAGEVIMGRFKVVG